MDSGDGFGFSRNSTELSGRSSTANSTSELELKPRLDDSKLKNLGDGVSEMNMMKEKFAKILLGEDMSGSGQGVCTALAISNAITNLSATVFGQLWRLEPLPPESKSLWKREMEWLLSVSEHIIELIPSCQTFPDGSKLEVMACRPRLDLYINLPALRKLDNMLLEVLDSFCSTEFWYIDQGKTAATGAAADGSASFHKAIIQREDEKWWLPVPRVLASGLSEDMRRQLSHKRECTTQILKAAMTINNITLSDMEVPESYLESLPKNGRTCLGESIYRYITSETFSSEYLLDCLDLSSEHAAVEIVNRLEASIHLWCGRRVGLKRIANRRSSWEMLRDLILYGERRALLVERAEDLLFYLKQRFPGLTQSCLETSKIQCNKDVGKAILESYSRVLESLAYRIVARIDDIMYVDDITRQQSDKLSLAASVISQKKFPILCSVPFSGTTLHHITALSMPSSKTGEERTPFLSCKKSKNKRPSRHGLGVKRALINYLSSETKLKKNTGNNLLLKRDSPSSRRMETKITAMH